MAEQKKKKRAKPSSNRDSRPQPTRFFPLQLTRGPRADDISDVTPGILDVRARESRRPWPPRRACAFKNGPRPSPARCCPSPEP